MRRDLPMEQHTPTASNILKLAERHCRPRLSLSSVLEERGQVTAKPEKSERSQSSQTTHISMDAKRLVMLNIAAPFNPTGLCYELLGINPRAGSAAKAEAVRKKLLIQHDFHPGRRGGKKVLLEPTKTAFAMFGLPTMYENPGFMHRYLQHQTKAAMTAKGVKATLEKCVNGKNIDVVLESDDEMIAVEIAVTDKHEVINLRKDVFQAGFDRVVIIGKDRKVVAAVEKKIGAAFDSDVLSKVTCCLLADFVEGKTK